MNTTQAKLFKFDKGFLYSYENQNKANLHEYMHKVVDRYKISGSGILNRFNTSPKEIEEIEFKLSHNGLNKDDYDSAINEYNLERKLIAEEYFKTGLI